MGSPLDKCPVHDEGGGHGGAQGDGDGSSPPTPIATAKMMSSVVMGPAPGLKKAPRPPQAAPVLPPPSMEVVVALDEQEDPEPLLLGNDDNDDGAPPGPAGSHLPGAAVPVAAALLELGPQSPSRNVDDDLPAPCGCPPAMENKVCIILGDGDGDAHGFRSLFYYLT